jgi:hypothetical protein
MLRRIVGFHQDTEAHWVAELECGHTQHVRHDPPWQVREWVLADATRAAHLGTTLNCVLCDAGLSTEELEASAAYRDARLRGLCHDGALEIARSSRP